MNPISARFITDAKQAIHAWHSASALSRAKKETFGQKLLRAAQSLFTIWFPPSPPPRRNAAQDIAFRHMCRRVRRLADCVTLTYARPALVYA